MDFAESVFGEHFIFRYRSSVADRNTVHGNSELALLWKSGSVQVCAVRHARDHLRHLLHAGPAFRHIVHCVALPEVYIPEDHSRCGLGGSGGCLDSGADAGGGLGGTCPP